MKLHVNLQDGFNGDEVKISINNKQVYHKKNVKTRTQISLADVLESQVNNGTAVIEIELVNKQIKQVIETQVTDSLHIGVSVSAQNEIVYHIQHTPFHYM